MEKEIYSSARGVLEQKKSEFVTLYALPLAKKNVHIIIYLTIFKF